MLRGPLEGSFTAMVTPFAGDGLDEPRLQAHVEFQIANGTAGLVPTGTTGESPTLSPREHLRVIELTVQAARGRLPVIAGTGANSTAEALELSLEAERLGADALLIVAPYYNRPTQRGLLLHYEKLLGATKLPVILYNIPGRTGVTVEPETMAKLRRSHANLAGVKEAGGNPDVVSRIFELCGDGLAILSGDDSLTLPFMAVGATGVISVVSNIAPRETADMVRAYRSGDLVTAVRLHRRLFPLVKALFKETSPGPIKAAMGLLGMGPDALRLPLAPIDDANREHLRAALRAFGFKV